MNEKLMEAILYILENIDNPESVGMKKLSKLLYFADFNFYKEHQDAITNVDYIKMDHGPVPDNIYDVVERLEEEGLLEVEKVDISDEIMKYDFETLDEPGFSHLSDEERACIDSVLSRFGSLSANDLEVLSHKDTPWQVTDMEEVIKYKLVFYRDEDFEEVVEI